MSLPPCAAVLRPQAIMQSVCYACVGQTEVHMSLKILQWQFRETGKKIDYDKQMQENQWVYEPTTI